MRILLVWLRLASALGCAVCVAGAAAAEPVRTAYSEAELVAERSAAAPGETLWAGLRLKHRPKWHSYWRNPGDSGLPTEIDWTLPPGWSAGEIAWPAPRRLPVGPFVNYGYEGEFVLPVPLQVPPDVQPGETVRIGATARWLACEEICVPEEARLALDLPVIAGSVTADPRWAGLFAAARAALPRPSPWPASVDGDGEHLRLRVEAPQLRADRLADVYFFPYDPEAIEHAAAQRVALDGAGLTLEIPRGVAKERPIDGLRGVLVVSERGEGDTVRRPWMIDAARGEVAPIAVADQARPIVGAAGGGIGLVRAALLAIAGGLLLNLMPCVFPVLFLKALGLARLGAGARHEVRAHGLVYTAGVLATFAALAGLMLVLRGSGAAIGWGFQLQQPAVVLLLAYLMAAIGLSLAGLFTVAGGANLGTALAARQGHAGAFFTGALAVVVATPCTAPFMGVALGFAVTQPAAAGLVIFLALGLGMALPFLLLSLFPGLARRLPRPGAWMDRVKQALAFPMFATAAWLIWVLAQQTGPNGVLAALAGIILIAFAAWAWNLAPAGAGRIAGRAVAAAALVAALLLARFPAHAPAEAADQSTADAAIAWERFEPDRIATLRRDGRAALVNLTAAWCITCEVNERLALSSPRVARALAERGVVPLKGDWTSGNPAITRYLQSFQRTGVPLYVLYPADPAAPPAVLPQILTEAIVLDALAALPTLQRAASSS